VAKCLRCGAGGEWLQGADLIAGEGTALLALPAKTAKRRFEIWYFSQLLNKHKSKGAVADASGLARSSIYKKLHKLGLIERSLSSQKPGGGDGQ